MKKVSDLKELRKIIRTRLISQSGIVGNHVVYGQTRYGSTIQHNVVEEGVLDETLLKTISDDDSFIVFNINNSVSDDDMTEEVNNSLTVYSSFRCIVSFYGKNCGLNAIKVSSRFLTQPLILDFENEGIHIQKIDNQEQLNEMCNGMIVTRQDIVIYFSCEIDVTESSHMDDYSSANIPEGLIRVE